MEGFSYVYILESESKPERHYTGLTQDLKQRLKAHNAGLSPHTSKFGPWRIRTAIAFKDASQARAFERYLKTSSGRAFARKHF